jgi:polysaccharide deacetylase family protein (PEP-CTERM system associated)
VAPELTVTVDLEDHRLHAGLPRRYPDIVHALLERFAARAVTATFFVVGDVARDVPALVRAIAAAGHEIACHGDDHTPLPKRDRAGFEFGIADVRRHLEDLAGRAVVGYRAPVFSLTPAVRWVPEVLQGLGFRYSSSVLPGANPLFGYPRAPAQAFRWPGGLLEIPVPLGRFGPWRMPFLGGVYLRYLPWPLINRALATSGKDAPLWTYCHAYDFDAGEPFMRMRGTSLPVSLILWCNRRGSWRRLERLLDAVRVAPPFAVQLESGRYTGAPLFSG